MSVNRPLHIPGRRFVLTKNKILESQKHTKSASEAARWLGVSYNTYKKWAKYYNLFEQNLNQSGKGIPKKPSNFKVQLDDIFRCNHPDYPEAILKKRILAEGLVEEQCAVCGWNEARVTDNKICLTLDYIDNDKNNKSFENLRLVCPNCYFTNVGNFKSSKIFCK